MVNVYENESYVVQVNPEYTMVDIEKNPFTGIYEVMNRETNIVEFRSPCLPECLMHAVHWDLALTSKSYLWPYKGDEDDDSPDRVVN